MTTERPSFFFFCFFFPLCRARLAPPDLNCRRQISSTSSNPRSFVLCVRICANFRLPEEQHQKTILQWASPVLKAEGMQTTKEFAETGVYAVLHGAFARHVLYIYYELLLAFPHIFCLLFPFHPATPMTLWYEFHSAYADALIY